MLEHLCACGLLLHSDGSRGCSKNSGCREILVG